MAKKFLTLQFHSGSDYLNADWIWSMVTQYYIQQFSNKNFHHVSLSVGPFTAFIWKNGNTLFGGSYTGIGEEAIEDIKDFIAAGGGIIYQEKIHPFVEYYPSEPESTGEKIANNPVESYPGVVMNSLNSFETLVQAACRRLTEPYDAWNGTEITDPGSYQYFGIDAVHEYLLKVVENSTVVQHKAIIKADALVNWWAAYLCGVERGEFAGPAPFAPNYLPSGTETTPDPSKIWLDNYKDVFAETPFFWVCGLLSFIPIRPLNETYGWPEDNDRLTNFDKVPVDEDENVWCDKTPTEKATWVMDYIMNDASMADVQLGAYFYSEACHYAKYPWYYALPKYNAANVDYRNYLRYTSGIPLMPPRDMDEAHLTSAAQGTDPGEYGKWKELFEDWLDYMSNSARGNWFNNANCVWFSDREAKDLVVPQYDGSVTVDATRLEAIADYLINIDPLTGNWQRGTNEWNEEFPFVPVNRPPDYVSITVGETKEYYSLSECWWHMLSALNDIAEGSAISYKTLEPVIGPSEPESLNATLTHPVAGTNNVYRILEWWQHDTEPIPEINYSDVIAQAPALFLQAKTDLIGPTFREDRQTRLRKVKALVNFTDQYGNRVEVNASEMLYLFAKALKHYYDEEEPEKFGLFPSHVLPKSYYTFLLNGRFDLIFTDNLKWLDLGQRWTLKPALLESV